MNAPWRERLRAWGAREALVGDAQPLCYADLADGARGWQEKFNAAGIWPGSIVAFEGDFSGRTVSLLLALVEQRAVAVPLVSVTPAQKSDFLALAGAEFRIDCRPEAGAEIAALPGGLPHALIEALRASGRPGLVLFSSGSTGQPKAILHDFDRLLAKFSTPRPAGRMLSFLLLDHIGGINTLFHALANGSTIVTVADRRPESICRAIAKYRVQILPTSPTFLNLLLLSGEYQRHDLSSLRLITYGTEVMPASTLARLREVFPQVRLQQTYGLSELGILRSKSREDGSLWVKVGGEGNETKIVDGVLWIRAESAMVGYLNAENPFDQEGWFNTHDAVEREGDWLRFLGRASDIINVGGQKVYPAEVESILLQMENVVDATVRAEFHPLVGQIVAARVNLRQPESLVDFKTRMRKFCHSRLTPYMVPVKVEIMAAVQHSVRGKRLR